MNWDWDKLQEKRQNQQGWNAGGKGNRENDPGSNDPQGTETRRRAQRSPMGRGGGGSGGGNDPLQSLKAFKLPGGKWWVLGIVAIWLLSGIYIVHPGEEGIILQFGKYNRTAGEGPHYHLPYPIEQVYKPRVDLTRYIEVGYRSQASDATFQQGRLQPVDEESSMLTGDENIIHVQFSIQYRIKPDGAVDYLFNVTQPDDVVKKAGEAAMREVIGRNTLDVALTSGRIYIQTEVAARLQEILDRYQLGVQVLAVQMQNVQPPYEVRDAFRDVASARENKEQSINQAEAYEREVLPRAQGQAAQVVNEAEAYRQTRIRAAEGESQRFLALMVEYEKAQDVTRKRMLFEAMEEILGRPGMEKLILPSDVGGNILPLLPLDGGTSRSLIPSRAPSTDSSVNSQTGSSSLSDMSSSASSTVGSTGTNASSAELSARTARQVRRTN